MNTATQTNFKVFLALIAGVALAFTFTAFAIEAGAQTTVDGTVSGTATTTSSNATTTDSGNQNGQLQARISELEDEVDDLRSELTTLRAHVDALIAMMGSGTTTGSTGSTGGTATSTSGNSSATSTMTVMVGPENYSVRSGTSMDFSGRGYWANEPVTIMDSQGNVIGTARADSSGSFSTGSLSASSAIGTHTYTLRGDWSGVNGTMRVGVTL